MTENSFICKKLDSYNESPLRAIEKFKEEYPEIKIKIEDDRLAIFNYAIGANFSDPIIQEARGIIIDIRQNTVACWPFRKFGKYDEYYADEIDWSSAIAQNKLDGSIVKLWYDQVNNEWVWSSNSCIYASQAFITEDQRLSLMDVIEMTDGFQYLKNDDESYCGVNKCFTYIFEVVSMLNNVVVKYETPELIHIGTRNNITGEERNDDIGIVKPAIYPSLNSLESCIEFVTNRMNHKDKWGMIDNIDYEGLVVVDRNYNRIKVKTPEYQILHNIVEMTEKSKLRLVELLKENRLDVTKIGVKFPEVAYLLKWYDYQLSNFIYNAKSIIDISRKLYKRYDGDRKAVALLIKDDPYSALGFMGINNLDETADNIIWKKYGISKVAKSIPNYERISRSHMFEKIESDDVKNI
jgi:hypothetical protein